MSRSRPNVWIVHQSALPAGGTGITRHADLARAMLSRGIDVTIIAANFNHYQRGGQVVANTSAITDHDGVKFAWVKSSGYRNNGAKRAVSMIDFYVKAVSLRLAHKVGKPDVVIGSSPQPFSALAGLHLARRNRAHFALELRDVWPDDLVAMGAVSEGGYTQRALAALSRHLETKAERIVSAVPNLVPHLEANGISTDKIVYVPNGVFLDDHEEPEPIPETLEAELQACGDAFVVMYLGTHGQAHKLSNVLAAAKQLQENSEAPEIAFVLIGGGQERDELIAQAQAEGIRNVKFHPPIPKRAVATAAKRADALLVHLGPAATFDSYGRSPNKLYDYLAAGKPVLYSTLDESSLVSRERAGLIFKPGDPNALVEAVTTLSKQSPQERNEMGSRGRDALVGHHDLSVLGTKLAQMVEDLI